MSARVGTPLQAVKFTLTKFQDGFVGAMFLRDWFSGALSDGRFEATLALFTSFCAANPDEPERADGRKAHYGSGRQPLDDIVDAGWGPAFCAGNVLKYMRRDKQVEDSRRKAKWYWDRLYGEKPTDAGFEVFDQLVKLLTEDELRFLTDNG